MFMVIVSFALSSFTAGSLFGGFVVVARAFMAMPVISFVVVVVVAATIIAGRAMVSVSMRTIFVLHIN